MCAIFGFVNYRHLLSKKQLKDLVRDLSIESEARGTDASGIAYVKNGELKIYKKPKPAHKVRFYFPENTTILTGHTRYTTQGNAKFNYNNHPFKGSTSDGEFALCHNGVIYNDDIIAEKEQLPKTKIKTDSYIAVRLIEKYGSLNFDTIARMSETVQGNFVFTMLCDDNTLYISKGDNPICLLHFKTLGLYVYTSTKQIMTNVIKGSFLEKYRFDIIDVDEGEMIRIDKNGVLTRENFIPEYSCGSCVHGYYGFYDKADPDGYLLEVCNMFGVTQDDIIKLFEIGYSDEEIEVMLEDRQLLQTCLEEARAICGESF